jgi:uncharacterized ion transporter superfamily protein YfcC
MKYYGLFIYLIIFLKIIFFILSMMHIYFKIKDNKKNTANSNTNTNANNANNANNQKTIERVEYLRSRCEFIVTFLMSLLLIYIFNPLYPKIYLIDKETKYLFFIFGTILLLTAKWSDFFDTGNFFKLFQEFLS